MRTAEFPVIDVQAIAPGDRHPMIFSTFQRLPVEGAMELINDHDPMPLHAQFQAQQPGRFQWEYLERGPSRWRVRITKTASAHASGSCCGACGGSH